MSKAGNGASAPANKLYFGDNLHWLDKMPADSVDLIYLDPPFNSRLAYHVLYRSPEDAEQAQYQSFVDSWRWDKPADIALARIMSSKSPAAEIISALHNYMGTSDLMAYLVMMTVRLIQLQQVLKKDGTLWLHCDSSAGHYLKIILDTVFGPGSFRNEVIWKRSAAKSLMTRRLPTNHDTLLVYSSGDNYWNEEHAFAPYDPLNLPENVKEKYSQQDADGRCYQLTSLINPNPNRPRLTYEFLGVTRVWRWTRDRMQAAYDKGLVVQTEPGRVPRFKRYLDKQRGQPLDDVWTDIRPLNSQAQERLGYQTQKPMELLTRIIQLSSKPGDIVLDPFCGCGTAIEAAQDLDRNWIGIDITPLAIDVVERRLSRKGLRRKIHYEVEGAPIDMDGARRLFAEDPHMFQLWALTLVDGQPRDGGKRGADKGVDGLIFFQEDLRTIGRAVVSVKGGKNVHATDVRDLLGTLESQRARVGVLVTLHKTSAMDDAARDAKSLDVGGKTRRRIQVLTIEELLRGKKPDLPPVHDIISAAATARRAARTSEAAPPTPDKIREAPSFKLPISGGKQKSAQQHLPMDEPLLVQPQPRAKGRGRRSA